MKKMAMSVEEESDNTRVNRPTVVAPVKYKPKPGETVVRLPGRKPVIVRTKNEVVKQDNRTKEQRQLDWKKDEQTRQYYQEQKNNEEATKLATAVTKIISPSTYVGAAARAATGDGSFAGNVVEGQGFGDTTANVVFDLISPLVLNTGMRVGNKNIQKFNPFNVKYPHVDQNILQIMPKRTNGRYQFYSPTYQIYTGPKHEISEIINNDGSINLQNLIGVQNEALQNIPGGTIARHRLENPKWHPTDWNTFLHTRDVYKRALENNYPQEALFPTLMHDFGKMWAGDGHGPFGASIIQQMFPKASKQQIQAIYEHMLQNPQNNLSKLVKGVDIKEDNIFRTDGLYEYLLNNDEILTALRDTNAYGRDYYNALLNSSPQDNNNWFNLFRNAQKYLPTTVPVLPLTKKLSSNGGYTTGKDGDNQDDY